MVTNISLLVEQETKIGLSLGWVSGSIFRRVYPVKPNDMSLVHKNEQIAKLTKVNKVLIELFTTKL